LPRTLFGQILAAVVIGLLVAQALGLWLLLDERSRFAERIAGGQAVQRIAGMIDLLDGAEPQERARLVRALDFPPLRMTLGEPWRPNADEASEAARAYGERLAREIGRPLAIQVLSIRQGLRERARGERGAWRIQEATPGEGPPRERGPPRFTESEKGPRGEEFPGRRGEKGGRMPVLFVTVQARLADDAVVTFRHAVPSLAVERPLRIAALLAVTGVTVALLAGWVVRRLTRPLAALAQAASGLGRNLDQPPVPETGPIEVVRAAQAFNAMQREIRTYVETRAQALAGVSHDLRLPITRLRLRTEHVEDAALRRSIESDLDAMEHMIAGTLDYLRAGADAEPMVKLNVRALVEGVADDMEALGARVRIEGEVAAPLVARAQALRRALGNLLDNARRYGGGEIDVRLADAGGTVEIRIEDRGPGIPAAERERVFEPYVRLEASRSRNTGGTGLGLAIARAVARAHGGDIRFEDRAGGGLAAILTLPRAHDPASARAHGAAGTEDSPERA